MAAELTHFPPAQGMRCWRGCDDDGEPLLIFPDRVPRDEEAAAILEERENSLMLATITPLGSTAGNQLCDAMSCAGFVRAQHTNLPGALAAGAPASRWPLRGTLTRALLLFRQALSCITSAKA